MIFKVLSKPFYDSLLTWFEFSLSPVWQQCMLPDPVCNQSFPSLDSLIYSNTACTFQSNTTARQLTLFAGCHMNPYLLFSPQIVEIALESPQVLLCVPAMKPVGYILKIYLGGFSQCLSHIHRKKESHETRFSCMLRLSWQSNSRMISIGLI